MHLIWTAYLKSLIQWRRLHETPSPERYALKIRSILPLGAGTPELAAFRSKASTLYSDISSSFAKAMTRWVSDLSSASRRSGRNSSFKVQTNLSKMQSLTYSHVLYTSFISTSMCVGIHVFCLLIYIRPFFDFVKKYCFDHSR